MNKLTIVQGNDLLEGAYKVSIDEFRLLNIALSKIDSINSQPLDAYVITALEFKEAYRLKNPHVKLREAAIGLMHKPITLFEYDKKKNKLIGSVRHWFSLIEYDAGDEHSSVKVYFSEHVKPFLYELQKNFTSITFQNIAALNTSFSVRLYYWLSKAKNINNNNDVVELILDVEWIKIRAGLKNLYSDFRIFRRKLIEPAIENINRETDLTIRFETIKQGKKVVSIKFIYIQERSPDLVKPKRQRLPRRPKVASGSHEEGKWANKCILIILNHKKALQEKGEDLNKNDKEKLINLYNIVGNTLAINELNMT
ncbi:replication initiation protein [uncultured Shewanella sp.]|uniref:replication initiation protein n=1 Tax=uncultured Shewanella sp. TaxID=173975 RepID=UPI00260CA97D|nr:replication initiation protein [uncultured Shewanella sp.]